MNKLGSLRSLTVGVGLIRPDTGLIYQARTTLKFLNTKLGRLRQQPVGVPRLPSGGQEFIEPANGLDKCRGDIYNARSFYNFGISYNKLFLILIFSSLILTSCGAGKPKGGEGISYFGAAWLNNERIIYTKQVERVRFSYNPIAALGNNTSQLVRTDYFICTMDLNGEDEKILKQFSVTDPKGGKGVRRIFMVEKGKEILLSTERPQRPSVYSCSNDLIVFVARISEGGQGLQVQYM